MTSLRNVILLSLLLAGGCVVGDHFTTLTIHPDGSADLLIFRSNLHSTEKGEKGKQELADYKKNFKTQVEDEYARIKDAGGEVTKVLWVREQAPFSNVVRVHLATASTLEKFGTFQTDDGSLRTTATFRSEGSHRRLSIRVTMTSDKKQAIGPLPQDIKELKQAQADALSETRIAVVGGSITAARGFVVAGDKQSAILDLAEIAEVIRGEAESEFFLEWDVAP
ncbi:MAG TPA: hypothetical protein PK992_18265 [Planctomycetaceae bacterium]|nr:hypothetical protein [Planctomycetaceae bacterium]